MEILSYVHVEKIFFEKNFLSAKVIQRNAFIFENERRTDFDVNTLRGKRKLFSGIISYGAPNKPEAYLEPSRTSAVDLFLQK